MAVFFLVGKGLGDEAFPLIPGYVFVLDTVHGTHSAIMHLARRSPGHGRIAASVKAQTFVQ